MIHEAKPFRYERDFEEFIRHLITSRITERMPEYRLFRSKKAVDILISKEGPKPALYFIEVKFHRLNHGRLGFGGRGGIGFQPEILTHRPAYFGRYMRWALAREDKPDEFHFLASDQLADYVSGGGTGNKYNNIQMRLFREMRGLSEKEFGDSLEQWLVEP